MTLPSNFHESVKQLKKSIEEQLRSHAMEIIEKEIQNILGDVKILVSSDLKDHDRLQWYIEKSNKVE